MDRVMPEVTTDPAGLRRQAREWRAAGQRVALVPTMGNLHAGHLALVEQARATADRVIVSIFVNPLQFGPDEDYADYPRVLDADRERLGGLGVDLVFAPTPETLYPLGLERAVRVHVPDLEDVLCGAERPGHFAGVATVVAKLFNVTEPDTAVFGEKDYQQLLIIRRLAADLGFGIDVQGVPTVREPDGLALSSRNDYLDADERGRAPKLHTILVETAMAVARGESDFDRLAADGIERLRAAGLEPGYLEVRRSDDLSRPGPGDAPADLRVLAAVYLGRARLIDNVPVPAGVAA